VDDKPLEPRTILTFRLSVSPDNRTFRIEDTANRWLILHRTSTDQILLSSSKEGDANRLLEFDTQPVDIGEFMERLLSNQPASLRNLSLFIQTLGKVSLAVMHSQAAFEELDK